MNDLPWLVCGFTWRSMTAGLPCRYSKAKALECSTNPTAAPGVAASCSLLDFSTFLTSDPFDLSAHMCSDWSVLFFLLLKESLETVSAWLKNELQRLAWKEAIHHGWRSFSIVLSQGCIAFNRLGLFCFMNMFLIAIGKAKTGEKPYLIEFWSSVISFGRKSSRSTNLKPDLHDQSKILFIHIFPVQSSLWRKKNVNIIIILLHNFKNRCVFKPYFQV